MIGKEREGWALLAVMMLFLAVTVLATAGVFFTLQAEYLGAVQILIYGGGIVVLYIFVIIIVNLKEVLPEKRRFFPKLALAAGPALLGAEIIAVLVGTRFAPPAGHERGPELASLAEMLLTTYLVPFEIASALLLAVLVGAVIIARRKSLHDPD